MHNHIEIVRFSGRSLIKIIYDKNKNIIKRLVNYDPKHPDSYGFLFNAEGKRIGRLCGDNPKHKLSWRYIN